MRSREGAEQSVAMQVRMKWGEEQHYLGVVERSARETTTGVVIEAGVAAETEEEEW